MFASLYQHPNVSLIVRSQTHVDAIDNCFNISGNKSIYVMDDFDEQQLLEVIEREKTHKSSSAA